jgi:hypothetical protein
MLSCSSRLATHAQTAGIKRTALSTRRRFLWSGSAESRECRRLSEVQHVGIRQYGRCRIHAPKHIRVGPRTALSRKIVRFSSTSRCQPREGGGGGT